MVAQHVPVDGELAEHVAEPVAQQREQQPAALRGVHRAGVGGPVDVEPARVRGVGSVPQDVPERLVELLGHGDGHVVGHHVGDQPQAVPAGLGGQLPQGVLAAELFADPAVVDRVVAVGGAGGGLQQWGEVQVGDAECGQVGHGCGGVVQGEGGLELEPVAGGGGLDRVRPAVTGRAWLRGLGG